MVNLRHSMKSKKHSKMTPSEMQEAIDWLQFELNTLCLITSEPGQTPVHPTETIDRSEASTTRANDAVVESVLAEF
jgi:hypothetical protein